MNNTALAKHQWLYEQGFEPDMVLDVDMSKTLTISNDKGECVSLQTNVIDSAVYDLGKLDEEFRPWFSESRLWSFIDGKFALMGACNLILRDPVPNLLDKLLDIIILAVKEGHLKAEVAK